jgi:hypothetical protein
MSFHQKIQYHALHLMYGMSGTKMTESMLASDPSLAEKIKLRNVCALIPNEVFERLEATCGLLDISKREFIQAAIQEALDLADKVMEETGLDDRLEAIAQEQAKAKE